MRQIVRKSKGSLKDIELKKYQTVGEVESDTSKFYKFYKKGEKALKNYGKTGRTVDPAKSAEELEKLREKIRKYK